jgi:pimeloyl-ACP methyl ester carboxylesterase
MTSDHRIREAETRLFARSGLQPEESFLHQARPAITKIPGAMLHEVPGGHGPWLEDPAGCAKLVISHLTATGFAPASYPA